MCGRFGLFAELEELAEQFGFDGSAVEGVYSPRWNIAPTMPVLTVRSGQAGGRQAEYMRWGMRMMGSHWSARDGLLINARAETVHELPSFRRAFAEGRCIIPANGFYEWKAANAPIWFSRGNGEAFAFAGISTGDDCAIITCEANEVARAVHDRMPVILPRQGYESWLSPQASVDALLAMLRPGRWTDMGFRSVSRAVNRASNDMPSLIEEVSQGALFGDWGADGAG